jgi:hypothetical protein
MESTNYHIVYVAESTISSCLGIGWGVMVRLTQKVNPLRSDDQVVGLRKMLY